MGLGVGICPLIVNSCSDNYARYCVYKALLDMIS